jgi:acyl carrier protein
LWQNINREIADGVIMENIEKIRSVLAKHARLAVDVEDLKDDSDLYEAGLTSLTTVNLMLALEDLFEVEFTDAMLGRKTFQTIQSLSEAIEELLK